MIIPGNEIQIGDAVGIAPERTRYPVLVTLLSGGEIYHAEIGHPKSHRCVIDLSSIQFNNRLISTYNHESSEVIGYGENARVENNQAVCNGYVIPFKPADRAEEIIFRAKEGTPYESSVEFTPEAAVRDEVAAGLAVEVNGNMLEGPAYIYRDVTIRAYAVCPVGADSGAKTIFLKKENMMTKPINQVVTKLSEDNAKKGDSENSANSENGSKYPDLDELEKMFGDELGVKMFKDGVSLEDAKKVFEFNEKWGIIPKPAEEPKKDDEPPADDPPTDPPAEPKKETAELKAQFAKLSASNEKLTGTVAKLTAQLATIGDTDPVSGTPAGGNGQKKPASAKDEYIAGFAKHFV